MSTTSTTRLRREIKENIDRVPTDRLPSLADFVEFLGRQEFDRKLKAAEKDIAEGKGVNWRKVRKDV